MSSRVYSIQDLLVGTYYRSQSRHIDGTITHAEKRENVSYGEGYEAYLITFRAQHESGNAKAYGREYHATVAVKVGE